jgi:hypothetical protein
MKTYGQWIAWSLKIGDRAFKNVRPIAMSIQKRTVTSRVKGFWLFPRYNTVETGEWEIVFVFDRGPLTTTRSSSILFDNESKARACFDQVFNAVFLKNHSSHHVPPAPKHRKIKTKKPHLSLVKDDN